MYDGMNAFCEGQKTLEDKLLSQGEIKVFEPKHTLITQGQQDDHVFILLSGSANVILYSKAGHEFWLDELLPGALFGDMAILLGETRTASVVSASTGTVLILEALVFNQLLLTEPAFARRVVDILARRVQLTSQRMLEKDVLSVPGRVYSELMRIGVPCQDDDIYHNIENAPSVVDFSKRLNASRESVSRALSRLEKSGMLKRDGKCWTLFAPGLETPQSIIL